MSQSEDSGETLEVYTLQEDKACKLLRVIKPAVVFINCPPLVDLTRFFECLNNEFNIKDGGLIENNVDKLKDYLKKHNFKTPLIITGFVSNPDIIYDIFGSTCFTYAFAYPPEPSKYEHYISEKSKDKNFLDLIPSDLHKLAKSILKDTDSKSANITKLRKKLMKLSIDVYNTHICTFNTFTIKPQKSAKSTQAKST